MDGVAWIVQSDLVAQIDPAVLVDHVTDWIMAQHRAAIVAGERADGTGKHEPRMIRRDGEKLKSDDPVRGHDTGYMADHLERTMIRTRGAKRKADGILSGPTLAKSSLVKMSKLGVASGGKVFGTSARSSIHMPTVSLDDVKRRKFLEREGSGVNAIGYFYIEGAIESGITECLQQWVDAAMDGDLRNPNMKAMRSKDGKHATG